MPDDIFGDPVPEHGRPNRQRQLADHHQRTVAQRVQDCLDYPLLYEMAGLLPPPANVGCPREYLAIVYMLLAALTPVTKSKRSAVGLMASPREWRSVRAHIRRHLGRRAAAVLPLNAPSRNQFQDAVDKLLVPSSDALEEAFRSYAARQALEQGLFPSSVPKVWSRPERRQLLVGDAMVPRAISKARKSETVDESTGVLRNHRVDPAARVYYENGEKAKREVRGTKWFFTSGRSDGYWTRVILSFAYVAGGEYEDEAAVAVRQFTMLKDVLPDCMGIVYDGALRGVHRDALARRGMLAINKQHGSVTPAFYEHIKPCRSGHELWCNEGRIAESISLDDGTRILAPPSWSPASVSPRAAGATSCASPAVTGTTHTASPSASPPLLRIALCVKPTAGNAPRATVSADSTAPNCSSRSPSPHSHTSSSTPTARTPSPYTPSSTRVSGTAAWSPMASNGRRCSSSASPSPRTRRATRSTWKGAATRNLCPRWPDPLPPMSTRRLRPIGGGRRVRRA